MKSIIILLLLSLLFFCVKIVYADGKSSTTKQNPKNAPSTGNGGSGDFSNESLFTGDVAFPLPISTLGGIDVKLNYSSNIHKIVHADNKDIQAGWAGLGWSLNLGSITADINGTRDVSDDRYFYVGSAGSSELILISSNDFMLKDYQYWKITRSLDVNGNLIGWTIVTDDGTIMRYGNYNEATSSFLFDLTLTKATRFMIGIEGIVCNPLNDDYSSTHLISYQWDISDVQDIAGNHTTIIYQQETDVLSVNSISTSIYYTQESHPYQIIDWSGRSLQFDLGDLVVNVEYTPPPDKILQRQFEKKFLEKVIVKDANNSIVQQTVFNYVVLDIFNQSASKRYLTSITSKDANDNSLPSTTFSYFTTSESLGENPGALKSILYPSGSNVEYTYTNQTLNNVTLDLTQTEDSSPYFNMSLAGSDFYAVKTASNSLKVYRWGIKGWYIDDTFPYTSSIIEHWVRNDYIVYYQGGNTLKITKRQNDGWVTSEISLDNSQSPGSMKLIAASSNFFLIAHNLQKYDFSDNKCQRKEKLSVVRWNVNLWEASYIDNFQLGKIYQYADVHLNAAVGREFFAVQNCDNTNGEIFEDCRVYVRNANTWIYKFGFKPDPGNWGDYDGHAFNLFAGPDYFITYAYRHPNNPEYRSIKMYTWPFNSVNDMWGYSNIDARAGIYAGESYFVTIGGDEISSSGYQSPILIHSFNGNPSNDYPYTVTDIGIMFAGLKKHTNLALGKDYISIGWINGSAGYLGIVKNLDGQWTDGSIIEYISNLGTDGYVTPVNNGMTLFSEWYSINNYHKVRAYKEQNNTWTFNTELDNIPLNSGIYDAPTFTQPGLQFLTDNIKPGTTGDIVSHGFMEGTGQGGSSLFSGNPSDYPVSTKVVSDAMGNSYVTTYSFENGIYDNGLNSAKYNKATVTPPGNNGKTITYFYNDLGPTEAEEFVNVPHYQELDGIEYKIKVFSQNDLMNPISTTTNSWAVFAIDEESEVYHKRLIKSVSIVDGIAREVEYEYNNTNGQVSKVIEPVEVSSDQGGVRNRLTEFSYACSQPQYSEMLAANMLTQKYETKTSSTGIRTISVMVDGTYLQNDQTQFVVAFDQVVTYNANVHSPFITAYFCIGTTPGGYDIVDKKYADASGSFQANVGVTYYLTAFSSGCNAHHGCATAGGWVTYSLSSNPESIVISWERTEYNENKYPFRISSFNGTNWIEKNTVTSFNSHGNVIESYDVDELYSTTKYGNSSAMPKANIINAKNSETAIADFEDGTLGEWSSYTTGGEIGNTAHTGNKGWHFDNTGAYTITKTFTPPDVNTLGKYIFSAWVKTNSASPSLQFGYEDGSGGQYPIMVSASGTGHWEYLEMVIDFNNYPSVNYYAMFVKNENAICDWDNIRFYPSDAAMTTTTYDATTLQIISQTDANNVTIYFEYDNFGRQIESLNDDRLVMSENNHFSSVEKFGSFNIEYPNSVVQKNYTYGNPVRNASFELGKNGAEPVGWTWDDGCTVTSERDAFTGSYAMKVIANRNDSYVHSYLYNSGYLKKNKQYQVSFWAKNTGGTSSVQTLLMKVDGSGDYKAYNHLDITVNGTAWQRYSGYITLDSDPDWDNPSYLSLIRLDVNQNENTVFFDDIQIEEGSELHLPAMTIAYSDGIGRTIQTQSCDGNFSFVNHIEYNSLGQQRRNWRTYKRNMPFAYDQNYSANCIAEHIVSNPYTEVTYYPDPLGRVHKNFPLAKSFVGEEVETVYGKSTIPGGGSTEFLYTDSKSKLGTANNIIINRKYSDKLGRVIRTATFKDGQSEEHITQTLYNFLYKPLEVTDPNGFVTNFEYDFLGRVIEKDAPDAEPVQYIYDTAGRLRFMLEGEGAIAQPFPKVLYWKYDILGRVIEKGYTNTLNYSRQIYQNLADASYWPTPYETWRKKYLYGSGEVDPNMRGRLEKILINSDDDADVEVEEYFTYDNYGNVLMHSTRAKNFNSSLHATQYEYDGSGRVIKIKYPTPLNNVVLENMTLGSGSPYYFDGTNITVGPSFTINSGANVTFEAGGEIRLLPGFTASNGAQFSAFIGSLPGQETPTEVTYAYNQRGQVESIGIPGDRDYYAAYTYSSDGAMINESLNNKPGVSPTPVTYIYDSKRRLSNINGGSNYFVENINYSYESVPEKDSPLQTQNYFGLMSETQFQFGWASPPQNYNVHYRYDDFGRMVTADNTLGSQWDIGVGANNQTTYDQNGNVTKMVVGSSTKNYVYYLNSNKIKNVDGSGNTHYDYDFNGNLDTNTPKNLTLSYDPFTQMTMQVSSPTATASFEYNSNNERLMKKDLSGNATLYLRGMNAYPLYEKQNTEGDGSFDKIYIYGPNGLIAVKRMEGTFFVLKDHLGSTRVILNGATGQPVNYFDYTAYGNTMRVGGGVGLKYQFTGQEFDDELGLHNFRARLYDSELGIFYGVDPAGQGFSPYGYAGNNPVTYIDKDGRIFWLIPVLIGAALGGYSGYQVAKAQGITGWGMFAHILGGAVVGGASGYAGFAVSTTGAVMQNTAGLVISSFTNSVGMSILTGQNMAGINFGIGNFSFGSGKVDWAFGEQGLLNNLADVPSVLCVANDLTAAFTVDYEEVKNVEKQVSDKAAELDFTGEMGERTTSAWPYDELDDNWKEIGDEKLYNTFTSEIKYDQPLVSDLIPGPNSTRYGRWHIGKFFDSVSKQTKTTLHADYFDINKNWLWHGIESLMTPSSPYR